MKIYDSYKDSGVEWIGEIPIGWTTPRLKHSITKSFGGEVIDKSFWGDGPETLYTTSKKIHKSDYPNFNEERRTTESDLLLSRNGDGIVHIPPFGCIYTNVVQLVRIKDGVDRRFLWYSLTFQIKPLNSFSDGDFIVSLNKEQWFNLLTPLPPLSEQQQIVSFLDTKTLFIDSLIEKTQRKIELLKEKRTSLINEVVTKGLNPNVEMKDSGVEWIGEIPSHWEKPFFGLISNLQQGLQIPFDDRFFEKEEGMFEYITTKSVHNPNDPRQYILNPKKSVVCKRDEILYGRTGNTGEVITNVEGVFHNNFFKIDYDKNKIIKEYLIYQLTNSRFKETILLLSGTTTIPDLNHGDFNSMRCLIPPLQEQQQIVSHLDEQTQLIDKTITIEEKRTELLKEYRQSLISEVVTGKLKVTTDE